MTYRTYQIRRAIAATPFALAIIVTAIALIAIASI
jgi:hypothetical protein